MTRALVALLALVVMAPPAAAQTRPSTPSRTSRPPAPRRVELGVGGGVAGGLSLGTRDASLTSNNSSGSPFRLFATDTKLAPAAVLEGRLGYRLTPRFTLDGTITIGRPELTSSLSADAESAPSVDATERVTEYVVTGGASWRLISGARRRWIPFVSGGAGVARHVHDGQALIESGVDTYFGGGVQRQLSARAGVRVDGRLHLLSGGIAEGAGLTPRGALTGSILVAF